MRQRHHDRPPTDDRRAARVVEYRNPAGVHAPNREYGHAAIVTDPAARLCFVSGQVGADPHGAIAPTLDGQIEQAFANLDAVLTDLGTTLDNIVQLTTYLVDATDISAFAASRTRLFPSLFPGGYPPNTLVIVDALARPALRIEVQAIAAIPGDRGAQRSPPASQRGAAGGGDSGRR